MPYTKDFVVSSKSKRVLNAIHGKFGYSEENGKLKIDMRIEVFATNNHKKLAREAYKALKTTKLANKLYKIRVESKY